MQHNNDTRPISTSIMESIRAGKVHMRPRWHFLLLSLFAIVGVLIVLLTLIYIASLAVFFLRDTGALLAPGLGARGWWTLLHSTPWMLVALLGIFLIVLEILVRRYEFVYRKSLLTSLFGIMAVIFFGALAIGQTPFHRELANRARIGGLPPPLNALYRFPVRMPPSSDDFHGPILAASSTGLVIYDEDGDGTTTIRFTPRTRFPDGADFRVGERVMVVGDVLPNGMIDAFGVRDIDD